MKLLDKVICICYIDDNLLNPAKHKEGKSILLSPCPESIPFAARNVRLCSGEDGSGVAGRGLYGTKAVTGTARYSSAALIDAGRGSDA